MRRVVSGAAVLVAIATVFNVAVVASGAPVVTQFAHIASGMGVDGTLTLAHWTDVRDVVELPDNSLLVRVTRRDVYGFHVAEGVIRLRDGVIDPTFAASGTTPGELDLPLDAGTKVLVRVDGRIHLSDAGAVLQYTAAGEPDVTFGNAGRAQFSTGGPDFELADGFVLELAPQDVTLGGLGLQVFSPAGALDSTRLVFTHLAASKVIPLDRPDGSHLVVAFDSPVASEPAHLLQIGSDGTLDTTFGGGDGIAPLHFEPGTAPGLLIDAALQADGRVVLMFSVGVNSVVVMRFNADGTKDTSFNSVGGVTVDGVGGSIVPEPDGRIDLCLWYRFESPPVANDDPNKTFLDRLLPDGIFDSFLNLGVHTPGSVTLGELGLTDHSGFALATRIRSGDLIVSQTQFDGSVSSARLVRIAFDTHRPLARRLSEPAQPNQSAFARRLGVASNP